MLCCCDGLSVADKIKAAMESSSEEQAFWFYEDFNADLPHLRTKSYAKKVFLRSLDYLDNDASDV